MKGTARPRAQTWLVSTVLFDDYECTLSDENVRACLKWVHDLQPHKPCSWHVHVSDSFISPSGWFFFTKPKAVPRLYNTISDSFHIVYLDHFSERVFIGHNILADNFTCDYQLGGTIVRSDYQPNAGLDWQTINFTWYSPGEYRPYRPTACVDGDNLRYILNGATQPGTRLYNTRRAEQQCVRFYYKLYDGRYEFGDISWVKSERMLQLVHVNEQIIAAAALADSFTLRELEALTLLSLFWDY